MMDDKNALINFIGSVYGQMKEIDNHIAATGSNAKFGNRSIELQNVLKEVVEAPAVPPQPQLLPQQSQPLPQQQITVQEIPQPLAPVALAPVQKTAIDQQQLELIFKNDEKSILNDIYNVLYDIKKLLIESQNNFKEKNKKVKKYVNCCLCGSQPKISKTAEGSIELKCTGCKNSEQDATEQLVKLKWNTVNKQL
jgi:hypothetical protein